MSYLFYNCKYGPFHLPSFTHPPPTQALPSVCSLDPWDWFSFVYLLWSVDPTDREIHIVFVLPCVTDFTGHRTSEVQPCHRVLTPSGGWVTRNLDLSQSFCSTFSGFSSWPVVEETHPSTICYLVELDIVGEKGTRLEYSSEASVLQGVLRKLV